VKASAEATKARKAAALSFIMLLYGIIILSILVVVLLG